MTIIFFALLIGIALGAVLKGVFKIGLVVALSVGVVFFTCRELNVDWHHVVGVAADQAHEQYRRVQPVSPARPTRAVAAPVHHKWWM